MATRAKRFEFTGGVDVDGRLVADVGEPVVAGDGWTPEHLVLSALSRCSLASLRFYAQRRDITVEGSARAEGVVTQREDDGRYAFVEVECELRVRLDPEPEGEALGALLARAEDGCFVGSSLRAKPRYRWIVNGREVPARR